MLPPVRTISGSSGSYQNSASVSASAHLTGDAIYPGQTADADRDVNPNHSGKLNVLLLNGRDAVPEGLTMIADALGRAVNLPRREGETASAYVNRLAQALRVLPSGLKADAEQELMKILRGVRLHLVIDAFLNPTGPEAARIVALLEMAGTTERDLATMTVLSSYRQNAGAELVPAPVGAGPVPQTAGAASPAPVAPVAAALPVSAEGDLPASAPAAIVAPAAAAEGADPAPGAPLLPAAFPEDAEEALGPIRYHKTDNIFSRTSAPEPQAEAIPENPGETTPVRRAMADLDPARLEARAADKAARLAQNGLPLPSDARGLQTVLNAAFAAGDSEDPLVQAKAAMHLLSGKEADAPAGGRLPVARRDFASRPFADYARPAPRPLPRPEDLPPIFGLKGWPEDMFIEPGILPAARSTEAALAATLVPHAGPEPDRVDPAYLLRGRGVAANDLGEHKAALEAAEQQLIRTADQAAGLSGDRRPEPAPRVERSGTDQLIAAALQMSADPRQALGFASQPYPVADERDDGPADRRGHRSSAHGDGEGEEQDEAPGEGHEPPQDHAAAEANPVKEAAEEAVAAQAAGQGNMEAGDPAYDYYQRMAGWS